MTRMEAEEIATALREYVDVMAYVAADRDNTTKSLEIQRLAFEALKGAFIKASRHG